MLSQCPMAMLCVDCLYLICVLLSPGLSAKFGMEQSGNLSGTEILPFSLLPCNTCDNLCVHSIAWGSSVPLCSLVLLYFVHI